jgi:hypothetical protein
MIRLALHQVKEDAPVAVVMCDGRTVVERSVKNQDLSPSLVELGGRPVTLDIFFV